MTDYEYFIILGGSDDPMDLLVREISLSCLMSKIRDAEEILSENPTHYSRYALPYLHKELGRRCRPEDN